MSLTFPISNFCQLFELFPEAFCGGGFKMRNFWNQILAHVINHGNLINVSVQFHSKQISWKISLALLAAPPCSEFVNSFENLTKDLLLRFKKHWLNAMVQRWINIHMMPRKDINLMQIDVENLSNMFPHKNPDQMARRKSIMTNPTKGCAKEHFIVKTLLVITSSAHSWYFLPPLSLRITDL